MGIEYQQLASLPDSFVDEIKREFAPYSVALARVVRDDPSSFRALGSGTLVRRNGRVGVLTARHCLHACDPCVSIGPGGTDSLLMVLRNGRSVIARPDALYEHQLAEPESEEYGPDITFVEILPGECQQRVLAVASAWPLDRDPDSLLEAFGTVGTLIVSVGFPESFCDTVITTNRIERLAYHMAFIGALMEGDVSTRGEWDYIDSGIDYGSSCRLPESFGGVSGGGVWGVKIRKSKDGLLSIDRSALVGMSFYQTPLIDQSRTIRGHFIRSLYKDAWEKGG